MESSFEPVDINHVVELSDGRLFIGGVPLTEIEENNLREEARTLRQFKIWKIIQETLRHKAIEKAILHSTEWEHTLAGKMMLHNLGIILSIVDILAKEKRKVTHNPK